MKQQTSFKRRVPLAFASAALAVLAGCASYSGIDSKARMVAPAAAGLESAAASPSLDSTWWRGFGEPRLDALIERTLAGNPSLRIAQSRLERAVAAAEGADAARAPQVNGVFEATRQRYSEHGLVPPPLAGSMSTSGTLQATASWELDFFGKNRAALEAAIGAERAAAADVEAARLLLAANVARLYVQLARLEDQREVATRTLAQREEVLSLIRQRVQAGLDTNVELRQGEAGLPEMRQQIEALAEQQALTRHALAALSSQAPGALDELSPRLKSVAAAPLPAQVPADLLGRRADIEAARWRVEAATKDVKAAKAEFYPNINLIAFAGFNSIGLDRIVESGSKVYGIGPAIHLPIFDAGRLRAGLRGKTADLDAAVESYNAAVLDAVRDVADQISSAQSIERQQREQAATQAAAESAYDLAVQRYRAGLGSYLTVLTAENNVLAQRRLATDLKARALDVQVGLMRALGGGYVAQQEQQAQQAGAAVAAR